MENINPKAVIITVYCLIQSGIIAIGEFVNAGFVAIRKAAIVGFTAAAIVFGISGVAITPSANADGHLRQCIYTEHVDGQSAAKNRCNDVSIRFYFCSRSGHYKCGQRGQYYQGSGTLPLAHGVTQSSHELLGRAEDGGFHFAICDIYEKIKQRDLSRHTYHCE